MSKFLLYLGICCVHSCVYTCTVHTDCDCTVVLLTDQSNAPIQGTQHHTSHTHHTDTTQTESNLNLQTGFGSTGCSGAEKMRSSIGGGGLRPPSHWLGLISQDKRNICINFFPPRKVRFIRYFLPNFRKLRVLWNKMGSLTNAILMIFCKITRINLRICLKSVLYKTCNKPSNNSEVVCESLFEIFLKL